MATYRANCDDTLVIKSEKELHYYWVRYTRKRHIPAKQTYKEESILQAYKPGEWADMVKMNAKVGLEFPNPAICGYQDYTICHDPTIMKEEDIKALKIA